jgi:hypothetical protein
MIISKPSGLLTIVMGRKIRNEYEKCDGAAGAATLLLTGPRLVYQSFRILFRRDVALENVFSHFVVMRTILPIVLLLIILGCSEDPVQPMEQFPLLDMDGQWRIVFETGVQWQLSIDQDSLCIEGYVQPDSTMQLFMEIEGKISEGTPNFGFEGYSWTFFHVFQCRMRGNESVFDGKMKLFDIVTNEDLEDFSFYAVKETGERADPAYPSLELHRISPEDHIPQPHFFIPSRMPTR